jgi:hypothetical protein
MRPLKNGSVRNALRGLRRSPSAGTNSRRKRAGVGAGIVAVVGGAYYALRRRNARR